MNKSLPALILWAVVIVGCGDDGGEDSADAAVLQTTFGGDRPVELLVPEAYDADQSWPLLMFLHGYSSSASRMLRYSKMDRLVDEVGLLLVAPNGLVDTVGLRFWNATDFCCDFSGRNVDDVAYLSGLIEEISEVYNVDPRRIYLWGHSNGGFMAHRLACDRAETFASVISFAGALHLEESACAPSAAISMLQLHGTADEVIAFDGDEQSYPSAVTTATRWATYNGCATSKQVTNSIDLTPDAAGSETTKEQFTDCPSEIDVELWSASGATHFPTITDNFRAVMWEWFAAHPKP